MMQGAARTRVVKSFDGAQIVYDQAEGSGAPVVLIHGWSCRRGQWREQAAALEGVPALALDLAGHGDSTAGTAPRSPAAFARDAVAVMEAEDLTGTVLVGHSMGGAVALEAALSAPERVAGVVLVDTFVLDYGGLDEAAQRALYEPFAADFRAAVDALVENTAGNVDESLKERLKAEMTESDSDVALPAWRALLAWDPAAALSGVEVPVHAINGDLIPASARERCAAFVVEHLVPNTGHFLHMEAPDRFNDTFTKALEALRG